MYTATSSGVRTRQLAASSLVHCMHAISPPHSAPMSLTVVWPPRRSTQREKLAH